MLVESQSLGLIVIQPTTLYIEESERANLLLFPQKISQESLLVGVEWAASTQTPIFCLPTDVTKFEEEGFGAYRFHKIDGYREVDFQGGSIEFFPARRRRLKGIKGLSQEMAEFMGWAPHPGYHVVIRPQGEASVLYLASTVVDNSEWKTLTQTNPQTIIGAEAHSKSEWHTFSTSVKRRIYWAAEFSHIKTQASGSTEQAPLLQRENPLWAVKAGSL